MDIDVTKDSVPLIINISDVNELPTLDFVTGDYFFTLPIVTEDTIWTWDGSLPQLSASDVDAGQENNLIWRMKFNTDGNYGTASISGTGKSPDSFTYSPNLIMTGLSEMIPSPWKYSMALV